MVDIAQRDLGLSQVEAALTVEPDAVHAEVLLGVDFEVVDDDLILCTLETEGEIVVAGLLDVQQMIVVAYNNKAYENEHYRNNDEGKRGKGRRYKYSCLQFLIVSQIGG